MPLKGKPQLSARHRNSLCAVTRIEAKVLRYSGGMLSEMAFTERSIEINERILKYIDEAPKSNMGIFKSQLLKANGYMELDPFFIEHCYVSCHVCFFVLSRFGPVWL